MKPIELKDIIVRRWPVRPLMKKTYDSPVLGFDTETNKDGYAVLIADSTGRHRIIKSFEDVRLFLTSVRSDLYKSINFFFNLEFDTNALLKYLPFDNIRELADLNQTTYEKVKIQIIPRKFLCFKIKSGNRYKRYRFYDISQFYQLGSLEKTFEKTFKVKYEKRLDASHGFEYGDINDEVIKYCIEDSQACQKLSENLVLACRQMVSINKFYSPASLGKALIRSNMTQQYKFMPTRLQQMALYSYNGGRIEVMKKGYFKKVYIYDINSAYPFIQSQLKEIGKINWRNKDFEPDAEHSFYHIRANIDDVIVSPVKYQIRKTGFLVYPKGANIDLYLAKCEVELLNDFGFDYKILDAVHNDGSPIEPFKYMRELYDLRRQYKKDGNPLQLPIKLGLNSSYGILIERQLKNKLIKPDDEDLMRPENTLLNYEGKAYVKRGDYFAGQFFNPVFASEITAGIRCKLYRDSIEHEKHLIKYSTDSMSFDRKIKLDFGGGIGQYGDSPEYEGLVVGNGVYTFFNDSERLTKFRSFGKEDIIKVAHDHLNENNYSYTKKSPRKLKESIKGDFDKFNVFIDKHKNMDINFDHKRLWERPADDFKDLLNNIICSEPLRYPVFDGGRYDMAGLREYAGMNLQTDESYVDSSLEKGENTDNYLNIRI